MQTEAADMSLAGEWARTLAGMPENVRKRMKTAGEPISKTGEPDGKLDLSFFQRQADVWNRMPGKLRYGDCRKCKNKGSVAFAHDDGDGNFEIRHVECDCMAKRRYLRNVRESGLSDMLNRYTLDNWNVRENWRRELSDAVRRYAEKPEGWFCVSGRPGTGKTHLCTALCGLLLEKGFPVRYMLWRDVSVRAKAAVNDAEDYSAIVEPLKRVKALYIDDFWKNGRGAPSDADIRLAFELLNARYADSALLTIFSTEMSLPALLAVDEAVGSRIAERTRGGRYHDLSERENWRITGGR